MRSFPGSANDGKVALGEATSSAPAGHLPLNRAFGAGEGQKSNEESRFLAVPFRAFIKKADMRSKWMLAQLMENNENRRIISWAGREKMTDRGCRRSGLSMQPRSRNTMRLSDDDNHQRRRLCWSTTP